MTLLLEALKVSHRDEKAIVFVETRVKVDQLVKELLSENLQVRGIHGDKT